MPPSERDPLTPVRVEAIDGAKGSFELVQLLPLRVYHPILLHAGRHAQHGSAHLDSACVSSRCRLDQDSGSGVFARNDPFNLDGNYFLDGILWGGNATDDEFWVSPDSQVGFEIPFDLIN